MSLLIHPITKEESMAITEYEKEGKKFYKVYVNIRGKDNKRIRVQKAIYDILTLSQALKEEKRLIKEVTGKVLKLEGKGLLWKEVMYRWELAAKKGMINTQMNYHTILDHVARLERYTSSWLEKTASDISRSDGRNVLINAKALGLSDSLINKIKSSINLVFIWGIEEGFIQGSLTNSKGPVYGLGFESSEEKIKPILTLEEVRKFLFEAKLRNHPWYPIWAFALLTGMRSGELMALLWEDVDLDNNIIRVSKSFNKRTKNIKCPKNGTWRNVDVNGQLKNLLIELRRERPNDTHVLPHFSEWKNGYAGEVLRRFLLSIGINKEVVFHTLRACFATHLLSQGVEPLKVMRMGGWSDLKTFQIYLRMSGVDVKGITKNYEITPEINDLWNVVLLNR